MIPFSDFFYYFASIDMFEVWKTQGNNVFCHSILIMMVSEANKTNMET